MIEDHNIKLRANTRWWDKNSMRKNSLSIVSNGWLSGISPSYVADDCRLVADARERRLRSTVSRTCVVTRTYGDRAFAADGPELWNSLPSHLNEADLWYKKSRRSLDNLFGWCGSTSQCEVF